ncbi:unnamed protein product [Cochlearia groenlandica]
MVMNLDLDIDLEKGLVFTKSPEKPIIPASPDTKPVLTGEEKIDSSPVQCAITKPVWGKIDRKKSASKPPRPPRGPSLDASDQKLVKEIAELAILKRARIERVRALKKSRAAKSASASEASSLSNFLATLLSVVFFAVVVIQGLSPRAVASVGKANVGFVSVQYGSEPGGSYTGPVLAQRLPKYVGSSI